jgi:hypothetical protein
VKTTELIEFIMVNIECAVNAILYMTMAHRKYALSVEPG